MASLTDYRYQLDTFTDELLKKSGSTVKRIDENIKLAHSLRLSNSLISQMDLQTNFLSNDLKKYQFYLTELNSLMIRGEYLETQLNILEAHQDLNKKRVSKGLTKLNDWRDDDLNLRTIEATLDNLNLEFHYVTKKVESRTPFSPKENRQFTYTDDKPVPISEPIKIPKTRTSNLKLKPMRCGSKTEESYSTPTSSKSFNFLTKKKTQLPTPDCSFHTPIFSHSSINQDYSSDTSIEEESSSVILKDSITFDESPLAFKTKQHMRSSSLPKSIDFTDSSVLEEFEDSFNKNGKFNLRHFISYDTGLKIKHGKESEDSVKDSQFLHSPVSLNLEDFLIGSSKSVKNETLSDVSCPAILEEDEKEVEGFEKEEGSEQKEEEEDKIEKEEEEQEEEEEVLIEQLPTFEHKLNRSNSCDSIFSTMKSRVPLYPTRDNRQQTLDWMKRFNNNDRANARECNVTMFSASNISKPSVYIDSRSALSHLARQPPANIQQKQPTSGTTSGALSSFQRFFKKAAPSQDSQPQPESAKPVITAAHIEINKPTASLPPISESSNAPEQNQWTTLLQKFNPHHLLPSQSLVTSEVGKTIPAGNTGNRQIHHNNQPEIVKGSFSTLTIGPNGSKYVQHGESSSLGQSLVLSSRISHTALRDALNNDLLF